jgi:hypothetical protein
MIYFEMMPGNNRNPSKELKNFNRCEKSCSVKGKTQLSITGYHLKIMINGELGFLRTVGNPCHQISIGRSSNVN